MKNLGIINVRAVKLLPYHPSAVVVRKVWDYRKNGLNIIQAREQLLAWRRIINRNPNNFDDIPLSKSKQLHAKLIQYRHEQAKLIKMVAGIKEYVGPNTDGMDYCDCWRKISTGASTILIERVESVQWQHGKYWPSKSTVSYTIYVLQQGWDAPLTPMRAWQNLLHSFSSPSCISQRTFTFAGPARGDLRVKITAQML